MNTSVRLASTANLTAATAEVGQTVDGVVLGPHDRVLLKNQTRSYENGIIDVQASGTGVLVRASDMREGTQIAAGSTVVVNEGTANANKTFVLLGIDPIRVGYDDLVFTDAVSGTVPTSRNINTSAPLSGGGNLTADRTISFPSWPANAVGVLTNDGAGVLTWGAGGAPEDAGYWTPLTNGDAVNPEIIFDGFGQAVAVWVPTP